LNLKCDILVSKFAFKFIFLTLRQGKYRVDKMEQEIAEMEKRWLASDGQSRPERFGADHEVMRRAFVKP
jgi:hypothetical protein